MHFEQVSSKRDESILYPISSYERREGLSISKGGGRFRNEEVAKFGNLICCWGIPFYRSCSAFLDEPGAYNCEAKDLLPQWWILPNQNWKYEDRELVLYSGPYMLTNRPVIVKGWRPRFNFKDGVLRTIPLWVCLSNLPLNCWGKDSLSRIGSIIGRPIYAYECISSINRISYTRILIEVDITYALPEVVKVQDPTWAEFDQVVEFDWKPKFCAKCL